MNYDYLDPELSIDMPDKADSAIALDFLLTAKTGVRNYAMALTECTTPEVRSALRRQMEAAIDLHGQISDLMITKKWLHPYNVDDQVQLDMKSAQLAVNVAGMALFPQDTDRLGTFATPNE